MAKKTITMKLSEITVVVDDDGLTKEELLTKAKEQVLAQLAERFPRLTYSVNEGTTLPVDVPRMGMIVKNPDTNELGIIVKMNPKTIDVAFGAFRVLRGSSLAFVMPSEDEVVDVDSILWGKAERNSHIHRDWGLNDTAFLKYQKTGEVSPVIITKVTGTAPNETYHAQVVGGDTYFKLKKEHLSMLKETRQEAEAMPNKKAKTTR